MEEEPDWDDVDKLDEEVFHEEL